MTHRINHSIIKGMPCWPSLMSGKELVPKYVIQMKIPFFLPVGWGKEEDWAQGQDLINTFQNNYHICKESRLL